MKASPLVLALLVLAPVLSATVAPATAVAADGNAVLAAIDGRAEAFRDQRYTASMEIRRGGKAQKTLVFEMVMQGLEKQFIEFTAPGDVAGMKILMADKTELWMYSPEFKKVRKIAAHAQNQGFLGSEFTPEDMTMAKLSSSWDADIVRKQGSQTTMLLTPKPGMASTWTRLEIVVDSSKGGITRIGYFDGSGKLVREQRREDWREHAGHSMPTRIVMQNKKTGDETVITFTNVRVNEGVDESTFSRRSLLRG